MTKKNILDNPIFVFVLSFFIATINIIFSSHFLSLLLAGVMFIVFVKMLDEKYYYSLLWVTITFLIIENVQGFKLFSLTLLSLFIYVFMKPILQRIFVSFELLKIIYIILFYSFMGILYIFFNYYDLEMIIILIINTIIDLIIVGVFV
jgi:hypothetical protein